MLQPSPLLISRVYDVTDAEVAPIDVVVEATSDELKALEKRDEIPKILSLTGRFRLTPAEGGVDLSGVVQAEMERECVVTLEPFTNVLEEPVQLQFRRHAVLPPDDHDIETDYPEPYDGETLDLGALMLEFFELGLDPHPRKPGAEFSFDTEALRISLSPFSILGAKLPS
jgi:hypothetical protein